MSEGDYELPLSPPEETETPDPSFSPATAHQPHKMASFPTPSTGSKSPNQNHVLTAIRRDRPHPRTTGGEFTCEHPDCTEKVPTFRRLCEWNKHMDRHERPYKCNEPGCETTQGFTYSGGLLRHQREVHKMHSTGKELLYCPYQNCSRATGEGFTRKENLEEHKRRRHQTELSSPTPNGATLKRKRLMTPQPEPVELESNGVSPDQEIEEILEQYPAVKRRIAMKDSYIRAQANEIQHLLRIIHSVPSQVYSVDSGPAIQQPRGVPVVPNRTNDKNLDTWHHG
jgi:hypothetical protein